MFIKSPAILARVDYKTLFCEMFSTYPTMLVWNPVLSSYGLYPFVQMFWFFVMESMK